MHYKFPIIEYINDVLPYVKDRDDIIVAEKDNYIVINYVVATNDTFTADLTDHANLIRRECRGLIFDKRTGKLISRRFHKFFNVNEREETLSENINFDKPHKIMHKADGSMIAPFITSDGVLRWGTKMGETDIANQVLDFVEKNTDYKKFAKSMCILNYTPIFEWCSRGNRVVLDHEEPKLILLAVRSTKFGFYLPMNAIRDLLENYDIEIIEELNSNASLSELIDFVRLETEHEGYVITFEDGHMAKIKTEWYVAIHKMKDNLLFERKVITMILDNTLDDIKPFVMEYDRKRLEDYEKSFWKWYNIQQLKLSISLTEIKDLDRKTFALEHAHKFGSFTPFIFKKFDEYTNNILTLHMKNDIIEMIKKNLISNTKLEEFKQKNGMDTKW